MVRPVFLDFYNMAKAVFGAGIGGVYLVFLALGVVGQHDIGGAIAAWLRVFGAVHRGRAQQVCSNACVDQYIALISEPVFRSQRSLAMDQRQPVYSAVRVKAGNIQRPVAQQVGISGAIIRYLAGRYIFILVIKAVIVAHIDNQPTIARNRGLGTFVAEPAKGSVFDRDRGRVHRVDFDHPAEFVGCMGFAVDVEPIMMSAPCVPHTGDAVALI